MAINNWWEGDFAERYWLEVRTEPVGFGEYLLAPQRNAAGREEWSYTLTSFVQPGDRVFHYDKRPGSDPAIVGWSDAVGPLETVGEWSWQARGTRGRVRGVPSVGPAWRMPLASYTELERPITRSMLSERAGEVFAVLAEVESRAAGSLYAPFQNRRDGLRAAQGYLSKLPAALVDLLFEAPTYYSAAATPTQSSRTARISRGQGYLSDAEKRTALERHAVELAKAHYIAAGATEIEERGKPFDLLVILEGVERHVEVKGSVGIGLESVQLTQGEVDHARRHQPTDLFVVDSIVAERQADDSVRTSGGVVRIWSGWVPEDRALRPTHLRYALPDR